MMMQRLFCLLLLLGSANFLFAQAVEDPLQYVDPFIGTEGQGNTFVGASLPSGMVKLSPDSGEKTSNAGYVPGEEIQGFSHTHVSGTGGGPKYGNILVMPLAEPKGEVMWTCYSLMLCRKTWMG